MKITGTKHGRHFHDTFNSRMCVWWYKFPEQCWVSLWLYSGLNNGIKFTLTIACKPNILPGNYGQIYVRERMSPNEGKERSSCNLSEMLKINFLISKNLQHLSIFATVKTMETIFLQWPPWGLKITHIKNIFYKIYS